MRGWWSLCQNPEVQEGNHVLAQDFIQPTVPPHSISWTLLRSAKFFQCLPAHGHQRAAELHSEMALMVGTLPTLPRGPHEVSPKYKTTSTNVTASQLLFVHGGGLIPKVRQPGNQGRKEKGTSHGDSIFKNGKSKDKRQDPEGSGGGDAEQRKEKGGRRPGKGAQKAEQREETWGRSATRKTEAGGA